MPVRWPFETRSTKRIKNLYQANLHELLWMWCHVRCQLHKEESRCRPPHDRELWILLWCVVSDHKLFQRSFKILQQSLSQEFTQSALSFRRWQKVCQGNGAYVHGIMNLIGAGRSSSLWPGFCLMTAVNLAIKGYLHDPVWPRLLRTGSLGFNICMTGSQRHLPQHL